jgi:lipopolysaccharide/colanic/teichoic acid biosynthesis glycosyltransferase
MLGHLAACQLLMILTRSSFDEAWGSYAWMGFAVVLAVIVESAGRPEEWRWTPGRGAARFRWLVSRRQWLWITVILALLLAFSRDQRISRMVLLIFEVTAFPVLYVLNRWGYPAFLKFLVGRSPHWRLRVALVGPDPWLGEVRKIIELNSTALVVERTYPVTGETEFNKISKWLRECGEIDLLVMPLRGLPDHWVGEMVALGDRYGFRCWLPLDLPMSQERSFELQRIGGLNMLTPPDHPLGNTFNRMLKRVFDIMVAVPLTLGVLLPLMALVKVLHLLFSPGPLFFRQERMGENGVSFMVIKFRTMHVSNDDEARQASPTDSRVFKGGRLLRKLSLDEFPQFLNVIRGQMSVVGPRPHMEDHERLFEKHYMRYGIRRWVKPGVTGLAQTCGFRGEVVTARDARGRARYDVLYITNWCIGLDFKIVARTAWQVIKPRGNAY